MYTVVILCKFVSLLLLIVHSLSQPDDLRYPTSYDPDSYPTSDELTWCTLIHGSDKWGLLFRRKKFIRMMDLGNTIHMAKE